MVSSFLDDTAYQYGWLILGSLLLAWLSFSRRPLAERLREGSVFRFTPRRARLIGWVWLAFAACWAIALAFSFRGRL